MARHISDWTRRVALLCREGPVTFSEALAAGMAIVPPGMAWRNGERSRKWNMAKYGKGAGIKHYLDPQQEETFRIRTGAREKVRSSLWTATSSGRFETYEEEGVKMIRTGPRPFTDKELE